MVRHASPTAFAAGTRVATGGLAQVTLAVKALVDAGDDRTILVFDDGTGEQMDLDLRGTAEAFEAHTAVWPEDVRAYASALAAEGLGPT